MRSSQKSEAGKRELNTLVIVYKGQLIRDIVRILEKLRDSNLKRLVCLSIPGDGSNIA